VILVRELPESDVEPFRHSLVAISSFGWPPSAGDSLGGPGQGQSGSSKPQTFGRPLQG
jgi:hypothetical protein